MCPCWADPGIGAGTPIVSAWVWFLASALSRAPFGAPAYRVQASDRPESAWTAGGSHPSALMGQASARNGDGSVDDRERAHPVEQLTGYHFKNKSLIQQALRHSSMADARVNSNERMEFLGDAVLGLVVCQRVYELFPHLLEGEMTKVKSAVVSRDTCAEIGRKLGLEKHLVLGNGMRGQACLPRSLAAGAVEALVAAIYLDGGLEPARAFLLPLVEPRIAQAVASGHQENYKSLLQQYSQQRLGETPVYVVVGQRGPDHAKEFEVAVSLDGHTHAACWGASKKAAEQSAALSALLALGLAEQQDGGVRLSPALARDGEEAEVDAAE